LDHLYESSKQVNHKPQNKVKFILLGLVVAVLAVVANTNGNSANEVRDFFATTAKTRASSAAEATFRLEKLATFKKLAKTAGQNIGFRDNSYYTPDVLRLETINEKEYIVVF